MNEDVKQAKDVKDAAHTLERWQEEKAAEWLYEQVARCEPDPAKAELFRNLAKAADTQATILAGDVANKIPTFSPSARLKFIAMLARRFTPRRMRNVLAATKVRGMSVYRGGRMGHAMPTSLADVGMHHRHGTGNVVRAGVFGVNDGVVSNTCLILGVAGAAGGARTIMLAGIAGLLAGAFSMAAGEWISMQSQRELFEFQIGQERDELERYPEEEAEELALIYNARGVPMDEARAFSKRLIEKPDEALDTLAREELGLNPDDLGSPWGAALSSFLCFSAGAIVPLLPYFFGFGVNLGYVAGLAGLTLVGVGAALSLFTGRSAVMGGIRMLVIGALAGAASYWIGDLLGVSMGG